MSIFHDTYPNPYTKSHTPGAGHAIPSAMMKACGAWWFFVLIQFIFISNQ